MSVLPAASDETARYAGPYLDLDEWRDEPVRHRYVHGGFEGDPLRFSLYLPPAEHYAGRFYQHITPVPLTENLAQSASGEEDRIAFAVSSGAYFLETNGGGDSGSPVSDVDPSVAGYRANAAAAEHSRVVAAEMYGDHRPYGYAFGGSGGAFRTFAGIENTQGVWDGVVPYVPGSPMAIPNVFSVRMHAMRVLRDAFDAIVDRIEPGGEGDVLDLLDEEQRAAFREVTRMGFPPRSWFGHRTMGIHAFAILYRALVSVDPQYFTDFWEQQGYLGADPTSSVHRDRVRHRSPVAEVLRESADSHHDDDAGRPGGVDHAFKPIAGPAGAVVAVRLASAPPRDVQTAELLVRSGAAAGGNCLLQGVAAGLATIDPQTGGSALAGLSVGDVVEIDNSNLLAAQTYHRHQVPSADFAVWDQFRTADGTPLYPQRPSLVGPQFAFGGAGSLQSGRFEGKMILVACLLDREAFPWQADWYRGLVADQLGSALDERFRLWFVDNALHGDDERQEHPTHTVSYLGVLHQALRDLSAWVENGTPPPPSTEYVVRDGQVRVADSARARKGVQPVLRLSADGGARADVRAGTEVVLRLEAEVPPGAGVIVGVEWDLAGEAVFMPEEAIAPGPRVEFERRAVFHEPGERFVAVRVTSRRDPEDRTPFARAQNIARVRIVVT